MADAVAPPIVARFQPLAPRDDERALIDAPGPLAGFRVGERLQILLEQDGAPLGAALLARADRPVLGSVLARAALVGPIGVAAAHRLDRVAEDAYRAILDRLTFTPPAPDIVSLRVLEEHTGLVDILWRLGLALDADARVTEERGGLRVDLVRRGARARLAMALAVRPSMALPALARRARRSGNDHQLLAYALDVQQPIPETPPRVDVKFAPASNEEVRRHPRQFGVGLTTAPDADPTRRYFVGTLNERVVYRITCAISAPALERLLSADIRASLPEPVALVSDGSTDPAFRGRGIHPAALRWMASWARENEVRTLVTFIEERNGASRRGAVKAGFVLLGNVASHESMR